MVNINVFQPDFGQREKDAIGRVLDSRWSGKGKLVKQFENEFAGHLGTPPNNIRSVSCCTEGMFQAMPLLGIGKGHEVILPTISFVGAANAIASSGATPIFCDVNSRTLNVEALDLAKCLSSKTRAILIQHYGGHPADLDDILAFSQQHGLHVIEDCACAVSSTYHGKAVGTFGDISSWSFDSMKILVSGDGGMVYCSDPKNADKFEKLTYLGLESSSGLSNAVDARWWEFELSAFGRRAIMNDLEASIGLIQLERLPGFINRRSGIYRQYNEALKDIEWLRIPPDPLPDTTTSYYMYWIQAESQDIRDSLAKYLREKGIYTTFRYYPLHWVKFYGHRGELPNAEQATRTTLCIPLHQGLSELDVEFIIESIRGFRS